MVALLGLAAAGLLALGFALFGRVPKGGPEFAFNGISRLATRLGYGPRPAQTTYEYAERLGELVPVASADLHLIATAKVEATYARMVPGESMLGILAGAYRRARVGLLRLIVRRPRVGGDHARLRAQIDRRLERPAPVATRFGLGARFVSQRRQVFRQVVRPKGRDAFAQGEDRYGAQAEGERPEALERHVEQAHQRQAEDAVMGDEQGPRFRRPIGDAGAGVTRDRALGE